MDGHVVADQAVGETIRLRVDPRPARLRVPLEVRPLHGDERRRGSSTSITGRSLRNPAARRLRPEVRPDDRRRQAGDVLSITSVAFVVNKRNVSAGPASRKPAGPIGSKTLPSPTRWPRTRRGKLFHRGYHAHLPFFPERIRRERPDHLFEASSTATRGLDPGVTRRGRSADAGRDRQCCGRPERVSRVRTLWSIVMRRRIPLTAMPAGANRFSPGFPAEHASHARRPRDPRPGRGRAPFKGPARGPT